MLTSTVRVEGGTLRRASVKTNGELPKGRLFDAMRELDGVVLKAPVAIGDVVVENLLGLGVDLVATKNVPAR